MANLFNKDFQDFIEALNSAAVRLWLSIKVKSQTISGIGENSMIAPFKKYI